MSNLIPLTDPSAPRCPLQFHLPCHLQEPTALFLCCSNSCPWTKVTQDPRGPAPAYSRFTSTSDPRKATLSCTPPVLIPALCQKRPSLLSYLLSLDLPSETS